MAARVTIQDIADALGISRNTVSKAINNTGVLADATREKVLKKAQEMGYKQFSYMNLVDTADTPQTNAAPSLPTDKGEIAVLTIGFIGGSHFAITMLDKFHRELAQLGYSLSLHRVLPEELEQKRLPFSLSFRPDRIAGIACIEMFDREYSKMVCSLGIPVLFIDCPADGFDEPLMADRLLMDNEGEIYHFIKEMTNRGKKTIGFIGQYMHCHSFYERYMNYRNAMYALGLPCQEEYCLLENKKGTTQTGGEAYREYLEERFQNMQQLPEVFLCANDFVALDVIKVLKKLGKSVPEDVWICGFDDSPESRMSTPSLTTIHIHSQIMGFAATQLLISRIREPNLNFRTMHTETSLVFRESTGD